MMYSKLINRHTNTHLRAVLIAAVEDEEGVRLAKEVLFVQFVGTQLHGGDVLRSNSRQSVFQQGAV